MAVNAIKPKLLNAMASENAVTEVKITAANLIFSVFIVLLVLG